MILDIGLTLEYLETKGVEVVGYQTKTLPAFFTRESDFEVNFNIETLAGFAKLFHTKRALSLCGGMFIASSIPKEYSMDKALIDNAINNALIEMDHLGIKGKEATPYLLGKVVELTQGKSLDSNIQLVFNNCRLASLISVELTNLGG